MSRKIQTRTSPIHGRGVFALRDLKKGERIIEYKGELISWEEALDRHPHDPQQPNHTFYFHIDDLCVIDGRVNGNSAKWINHSCAPNMVLKVQQGRIAFYALRHIDAGEELTVRYGATHYAGRLSCRCGAPNCMGRL